MIKEIKTTLKKAVIITAIGTLIFAATACAAKISVNAGYDEESSNQTISSEEDIHNTTISSTENSNNVENDIPTTTEVPTEVIIETEPVPIETQHAHYYDVEVVSPTCVKQGYTKHSCACGDEYISDHTDIVAHKYNFTIIEPTIDAEGYTKYVCDICNHTYCDNYTEKLPSYREVNETVWATADVNIRKGPGTEYEKVGNLSANSSIKRVGIGDNKWSKVEYNGEVCYISSNYLTTEEPYIETILEEMERRGNIGRLTIPSVGVNVALFNASIYDVGHSQGIVDRSDSAAYLYDADDYYGFDMIADHVHQGFNAIKWVTTGSTMAYIDYGTYTESYICTDMFIGYNGYGGRTGMFDANGSDVAGRNDGGLCLYTCNSDGTITITFWQPA